MPFAAFAIDEYAVRGTEAFELKMPFDEPKILQDSIEYMQVRISFLFIPAPEALQRASGLAGQR